MQESIENAYNEFKGSSEWTDIPTAQTVLNNVATARTYQWNGVDVVGVFLKDDGDWTEECEAIIERHSLEEVDEPHSGDQKRYFAPEDRAEQASRE